MPRRRKTVNIPIPTLRDLTQAAIHRYAEERANAIESYLAEQSRLYEKASRKGLIQALLERDREIQIKARELVDLREGGRLMRALLNGLFGGLTDRVQHLEDELENPNR